MTETPSNLKDAQVLIIDGTPANIDVLCALNQVSLATQFN